MTTPVTILREQASLLGVKTRNIVKAEVRSYHAPAASVQAGGAPIPSSPNALPLFNYSFNLVAPALGNYTYRLFYVAHDINLYPATISLDDDIAQEVDNFGGEVQVSNEEEFKDYLSRILGSQKTLKRISTIDYRKNPDQ